jgi:GGDEF domain-containing protein
MGRKLDRLLTRPADAPGPKTAQAAQGPPAPPERLPAEPPADAVAAFGRVERLLALPGGAEGEWPQILLDLLINLTGLSLGFLTSSLPGNGKRYHVRAMYPPDLRLDRLQTVGSGLAGWVHAKRQSLTLSTLNLDSDLSYLFHPGDGLTRATSFYGWPLSNGETMWGALMLAGEGETLDEPRKAFLEVLAQRLAAHCQQERLVVMAAEQRQLDPQTGLPHREAFLERLEALVESAKDPRLWLMCVSGLGNYSAGQGRREAGALLRALAQQLTRDVRPGWEAGHVAHGVFTLAAPQAESEAVEQAILGLQKRLNDWPLPPKAEKVYFIFHQALVRHPQDGGTAEELLEAALTKLALSE